MTALPKPAYVMSEPHLSGWRVVLGYETLADAQAAQSAVSAPEALEEALGNLLAVIHGDGGHRALEVGTKQAALEAEKIVANLLSSAPPAREGEWRPVVGFEGHYEVSAFGDVRNIKTGKVLAKNTMGRGYIKAEFWKDGERTQTSVHRVVAEAFLPRRDGLDEVNHIDGDKANNAAWNLEWTNRKGNTDHSRYVLGNDVIAVLATDKMTGRQEYYPSIEEAGRYGYNASCIQMCLKGQREDHAGKLWTKTPFREPTHPAAPSGDKLRIAVEALETSRENLIGWFEAIDAEIRVEHEMHVSLKDDLAVIDQALATLEAEGKS